LLSEIKEEVTNLLSDLIQIDTASPPRNETRAAKYLGETLEEDFNCELFESALGRCSVITRIKGTGEKPNLRYFRTLMWLLLTRKSGV